MGDTKNKSSKNIPKSLSDIRVCGAGSREKPYKLFDRSGLGLYVLVTPRGSKLWQLKYRFNGRERLASLGQYPVVSLSEARRRAIETRRLLEQGIDPNEDKRTRKKEKYTFAQLAKEWISKNSPRWSEGHREKIRSRLDRHVYRWLGARPIADITTPEILAILRRVENTGANELAHCCQQYTACAFIGE